MDKALNYRNFDVLAAHLTDDQLRAKIRLLLVYGCNGHEVMYITDEDQVYCYGRNRFGGLGLGHINEQIERPQLNQTLSGQQVVDVITGFEHWMALTSAGRVFAWGHNESGQLGINGVVETPTPQLIDGIKDETIVKLSCGGFHTLALTRDGRVFGWGRNYSGQVGDGRKGECRYLPIHISNIEQKIIDISCGVNHSMALTIDGEVLMWGQNKRGQLGQPQDMKTITTPLPVPDFYFNRFSKIICGPCHSLALTIDGDIYAFGDNTSGQIGNGMFCQTSSPFQVECGAKFKDIIAHKENDLSIAVTTDDRYYIWGLANNRRITSPKEVSVSSEETVFDVYVKYAKNKLTYKTLSLKQGNDWQPIGSPPKRFPDNVWRCIEKLNESQDLPKSCQKNESSEQKTNALTKKDKKPETIDDIIDIRRILKTSIVNSIPPHIRTSIRLLKNFNDARAIFVTQDDIVYSVGSNVHGFLGLGTNEKYIENPQINSILSGKQLIDIAHGFDFCIGLTRDGQCYAWGNNEYGQLGFGTLESSNVPKLIESIADLKVIQIVCGPYHVIALDSDGNVFSWGYNTFGQLGDKTYTNRTLPTQVLINESVAAISCGRAHTMALTGTGKVYIWGINEVGQLGRPREKDIRPGRIKAMSNSPGLISVTDTIIKAVCGPNHTLLLTSDGIVYGFGENTNGQVGNGSTEHQFTPIKLNSHIKVKEIVSHWENDLSLAVTNDNKYYVWGLVAKDVVTRPKRVVISDERSLFEIYVKCAKKNATFKTISIDEKLMCLRTETNDTNNQLTQNTTSDRQMATNGYAINGSHSSKFKVKKSFKNLVSSLANSDQCRVKSLDSVLDINLFPVLNTTLTNDDIQRIRLLSVFGHNGTEVIFVTKEDEVFAFGQNKSGCLGLGTFQKHIPEPQLNKTLSGKNLVNLFYGFEYCIGLTVEGKCYAWGQNGFGQLGIGSKIPNATPQLITRLSKEVVVMIGCGQNHALALTEEGKVYAWGNNALGQLGDGTYEDRLAPIHVQMVHPIRSICCGRNHSSAISKNLFVYFWGHNEYNQLGRDRSFDFRPERQQYIIYKPVLNRSFKDYGRVSKIVCGQNYSLFLTTEGDIYSFGDNSCGQLGNGSPSLMTPQKIEGIKFKDVIAVKENDLSIGISRDNKCYVWGLANNCAQLTPKEITEWPEQSLFNIYAKYSKSKVTYKTVIVCDTQSIPKDNLTKDVPSNGILHRLYTNGLIYNEEANSLTTNQGGDYLAQEIDQLASRLSLLNKPSYANHNGSDTTSNGYHEESSFDNLSVKSSVTDTTIADNILFNRMKNSFNDPMSSDLQFICEDSQIIYCHKTILQLRNQKFYDIISSRLTDGSVIRVASASYDAMYQFIRFLYGFEVRFTEQNVIDLQSMASVFEEKQLSDQCLQYITALHYTPNVSNVCTLYEKAVTEDNNDLKNSCIEFAAQHWKPICKTHAFLTMDDRLSKEFMIAVVNRQIDIDMN